MHLIVKTRITYSAINKNEFLYFCKKKNDNNTSKREKPKKSDRNVKASTKQN